jgi:hypothetical protein
VGGWESFRREKKKERNRVGGGEKIRFPKKKKTEIRGKKKTGKGAGRK